jgi:hypothetical protein
MIRFSLVNILIINLLSISLKAQADYTAMAKLPLATFWHKGDTYQYELIKGKKQYWENQLESQSDNRQLVTLSVKEANINGFVMEAQYNSAAYLLSDELKQLKGVEQLIARYQNFKVIYTISPKGEFIGISNGRDLQNMVIDILDLIPIKDDMTNTVVDNMRCQMTTEVYITEGLFQELRLLHQFYGNEYAPHTHQEYDTELANMLVPNGTPIPAKANLDVKLKEGRYCMIEHLLTPDEATIKKLTFNYLHKMSGEAIQGGNAEKLSMQVKDKGQYAYHLQTGWLIEYIKQRTTTLDKEKMEDYIIMRLLEKGSF